MARWTLITLAATIAIADLAQVPTLEWGLRLAGPIGGAVLYFGVGVATAWRRSIGPWFAVLSPVLPTTLLLAWAAGLTVPIAPDAPMLGVYTLQLAAAATGIRVLRRDQGHGADSRSGVPPSS